MRRCRRCRQAFVPSSRDERYCGCTPVTVTVECSECYDSFQAARRGQPGRPRKTCDAACALKRHRRLAIEQLNAERAEATLWWLKLTLDQRDAAMAYVRAEPPPPRWLGGKQLWAFFCRAAFTCEQRVASGVG